MKKRKITAAFNFKSEFNAMINQINRKKIENSALEGIKTNVSATYAKC